MAEELWAPKDPENTFLGQLQNSLGFESYADLHSWSINQPGEFWSRAWDELGLLGEKGDLPYDPGNDFISAKFFPFGFLNVAENLLVNGFEDEIAIVSIVEDGSRVEISWRQLRLLVGATTAAMKAEGITSGDRVVAWAPNVSEVIIYALAALSIGAIVSTASPDFAPHAVEDRFGQVEPKLLLAASSYSYNGKVFNCAEKVKEILELLPTVKRAISISDFQEWIQPFLGASPDFTPLPFNHPGFVLFSSGTTGKPKCIVHSGAGVLLKAAAEQRYQFNIAPGEKVFFFTTCGWMMWNWLTMALSRQATIVLYDGSPMYPNPERLFDLAQNEKVEFFGVSAKFIDSAHKEGLTPATTHELPALRLIASTGSVLSPESFDYVYSKIKKDVHLASMSGGTDICGCFVAGVPTLPVHRGEIQGACLGMATDVFDTTGASAAFDAKGELVCTVPFPSKPIGFWNDVAHEKYRAAYFEGFPGVWTHGDFAAKSEFGGFTLFGRSDATLNSKGVRIGTAEIYRVVETFPQVNEAMAVSQDWDGDTRVVLFLALKSGVVLDESLEKEIRGALRAQASPRHVPDKIVVAPQLPRTKSNKLVELAVTDVINGREVRNRDALANPEALDWFKDLPALQS